MPAESQPGPASPRGEPIGQDLQDELVVVAPQADDPGVPQGSSSSDSSEDDNEEEEEGILHGLLNGDMADVSAWSASDCVHLGLSRILDMDRANLRSMVIKMQKFMAADIEEKREMTERIDYLIGHIDNLKQDKIRNESAHNKMMEGINLIKDEALEAYNKMMEGHNLILKGKGEMIEAKDVIIRRNDNEIERLNRQIQELKQMVKELKEPTESRESHPSPVNTGCLSKFLKSD